MTRALARPEQAADSTEPDWNLLYGRQQNWSRWNNWSGSWRAYQGRETYQSVDGDDDNGQEAQLVVRTRRAMQKMEARVNIPSHGQSPKDVLPDSTCGWLVLQRSGLSESSKKTVLGSTLRTRWVDRESWKFSNNSGQITNSLVKDGERKRDRDRKMCVRPRRSRRGEAGDASERNSNR